MLIMKARTHQETVVRGRDLLLHDSATCGTLGAGGAAPVGAQGRHGGSVAGDNGAEMKTSTAKCRSQTRRR